MLYYTFACVKSVLLYHRYGNQTLINIQVLLTPGVVPFGLCQQFFTKFDEKSKRSWTHCQWHLMVAEEGH